LPALRLSIVLRFFQRVFSYFAPDWPFLAGQFALIACSTGLGLLMAWPWAVMVDSSLGDGSRNGLMHRTFLSVLPADKSLQIVGLASIGFAMKFLQDLIGSTTAANWNLINWRGTQRVRADLFRKLQRLQLEFHRSRPQGDTIYRVTQDTWGLQFILGVLINTTVAVVTLCVGVWILFSMNSRLALAALSIAPLLVLTNLLWTKKLTKRITTVKEAETRFTSSVQQSLATVGLAQAFAQEEQAVGSFQKTGREMVGAWWSHTRQQMAYNLVVGTIFGLGGAIIFGYGGVLVRRGNAGVSLGDLGVFMSYLGLLWGPLGTITGFAASISNGVANTRRVFEVLDEPNRIQESADATALPVRPRELTLSGVGLSYEADHPVLQGVDATIRPGEFVAFVGQSGAGKSTLLNLLPRFYDPTHGQVLLDGTDVRDVQLADVRRHTAVVQQEPVILSTTVAENIAYGRPDAGIEDIRLAAEKAGALEFIERMPEGFATVLSEGGANLSGGQRQRLGLARALLTEAPILILDEPTASLDVENERRVIETLESLKGDRTIILVSHRLSTTANCDRIYVLDEGRIAESGRHDDLVAQDGLYARMAAGQAQIEPAVRYPKAA
jgi:subfamily B ATP-binding cassette protein MsbA